ncbi:uncharacterized protein LOC114366456 [Ostrinia furnacalis]|uniref:uncharacterized protein LOC114366456 n=1 Tax=Ostrinia furnacalis TaxID=93504 RepID=UPI00103A4A56|nr:uncharacterized protein LOC114366456 [Ostrinia furnacalis]
MAVYNEDDKMKTNLKAYTDAIAKSQGLTTYKCDIKNLSAVQSLGIKTEVDIKGETVNGEKEINLFVKSKPVDDENNIKFISINDVYSRELYAYKDLSDIYRQLQEKANIPLKDRYRFIHVYEESDTDTIIMDNIAKKGFVNCHRCEIISLDCAKACIKQLARFHSLSFVLENEMLDYFNCNIKLLKYPLIYNEEYVTFLNNAYERCHNLLGDEYKMKLENIRNICERYYHYVNNDSVIRCLCHGDYTAQNIMMKSIDGKSTEVIPLDYQFIFYGSPVLDIIYLIFGTTDRDFRKDHLEDLKNVYHDTMKVFFSYFKMDINLHYPRKEFDKAFEESLEFVLMFSVWYLPKHLADENEVLNLNKTSLDYANIINDRVKSRLEGIIDDLTEWGVFDKNVEESKTTTNVSE